MRGIELIPIKCRVRFEKFNLSKAIADELERNNVRIKSGDILVVSSKFAAVSEQRIVDLSTVKPGKRARKLAKKYRMQPALAQLVLHESEKILGGIPGFLLALNKNVLSPNAGIDLSNAPTGMAILYPRDPKHTAQRIRKGILATITGSRERPAKRLGVILSDSRVTPTRLGTTGIAIATAGIRPTIDMRGSEDLFKNVLKVTLRSLADQVATAAEICMGEATESTPIVVARGVTQAFEKPRTRFEKMMTIPPEKCLIISGLRNGYIK
jgi:coenzyme F420-0:L-glutamate ligase / coenzyme F420-1:gamma-L-glutamate ligase